MVSLVQYIVIVLFAKDCNLIKLYFVYKYGEKS